MSGYYHKIFLVSQVPVPWVCSYQAILWSEQESSVPWLLRSNYVRLHAYCRQALLARLVANSSDILCCSFCRYALTQEAVTLLKHKETLVTSPRRRHPAICLFYLGGRYHRLPKPALQSVPQHCVSLLDLKASPRTYQTLPVGPMWSM